MTDRELAAIVTGVVSVVREHVERDLLTFGARLTALESREVRDGKDADPAVLAALQGDLTSLQQQAAQWRTSLDGLVPLVQGEVTKAMAGLRTPKDGIGLTGAVIDRSGHLLVTLSDGSVKDVGPVVGAPGAQGAPGTNGVNGRDAVLKGNVAMKRTSERSFQFCWSDGDPIEVIDLDGTRTKNAITYPVVLHRGVWESGRTYEEGDQVTLQGSNWIAKSTTTSRPGDGAPDWLLSTKRGSQGAQGPKGEPGPRGRDLTQMDHEGRKW